MVVAHHKGPEKRLVETGQGAPRQGEAQVEARGSPGEPEVPVEPCGLESGWWRETWQQA